MNTILRVSVPVLLLTLIFGFSASTVLAAAPTATVTLGSYSLKKGDSTPVTVTFSELVTGFDNADVSLPVPTLSAFSSGDGITYVATYTPIDDITAPTNVMSVNLSGVTSVSDNTSGTDFATSASYAIDTRAPVITIDPYSTDQTNADITVTASTDEGVLNTASNTFSTNGSFDFVATDAAGNVTTSTVVITNIDKTAPVIAAHSDVIAEGTLLAGATVSYSAPTTSDNMAPLTGVATCLPASGTHFAFGDTLVTCTASDTAGNVATPTTFTVHVVDTTAPAAPVITTPAQFASTTAMIHITGTAEADSTISISGGASVVTGVATLGAYDLLVTLNQNAINTLLVTATDSSNNTSAPATVVITHDNTAPTGTIQINGGALYTNTRSVTLTLTPAVDLSGITEMDIANASSYAGWEAYAPAKLWTLTTGDALKTVHVKYRDAAGNETSTGIATTITLDTVAPVITRTGASSVNSTYGDIYVDQGATTEPGVTVNTANPVNQYVLGDYTVTYTATDAAGNVATPVTRTVHVVARPLTVTANNVVKTYGTATVFTGTEFTTDGNLVLADAVTSVTLTSTGTTTTAGVSASPYAIVPSAAVGSGLSNYTITYVDGTLTVQKATATISVTPYAVTYDSLPHTAVGTAVGVFGESLAGLTVAATTHTNAGDYPADAWTFTDVTGNYTNAAGTVHDSIVQMPLTVTASAMSKIYGASDPILAYTHSALATGDTESVFSGALARTAGEEVNLYAISQGTLSAGGNYLITFVPNTFTIVPAAPVTTPGSIVFHGHQDVSFDAEANTAIYYTLDESTPTCASALYSTPFTFTNPTTLRAIRCDVNHAWNVSTVASRNFSPFTGTGGAGYSAPAPSLTVTAVTPAETPVVTPAAPAGQVLGEATYHFSVTLVFGSRGNEVKELQKALIARGYSIPAGATGYFGVQTRAAVIAFQKANKLPQTGVVGAQTRAVLNK